MTLVELLAHAHIAVDVAAEHVPTGERRLAQGILDLLGSAQPCGMIEPMVVPPPGDGTDGVVVISTETPGVYVAAEARSYAVLLLRAADMAEHKL